MSDTLSHAFTLADGSRLTALRDGQFFAPSDILLDLAGEAETQALKRDLPQVALDVNCYLLERLGRITLIDAGAGTAFGPSLGHMAAALAELGIEPGDIETVLLTHPHGDHIFGLIGADGNARFANAAVLCCGVDIAYFTSDAEREAAGPAKADAFAKARSVFSVLAHQLRPFEPGEVLPGVEAVALPGHTPGHCGFLIGGEAFVWGDVLHMADRQASHPTICTVFDNDPALALQTRRQAMTLAADRQLAVFGMHTPFGRRGKVLVDGDAFSIGFDD